MICLNCPASEGYCISLREYESEACCQRCEHVSLEAVPNGA